MKVNLVDLLECWDTPKSPKKFRTVAKLADYTERTNKTFHRDIAKQDKVLRVLLKRLF